MKTLFLAIAMLLSFVSFAKTLVIGSSPLNPPFEILAEAPNRFYGFDTDLMMEICKRTQNKCEFKSVRFNDLFTQINTKKIDLAISAIIITPERQNKFLFSTPYLQSSARFLTLNRSSAKNINDLVNKKIGVRLGTPFKELAYKLFKNNITIVEYAITADLLEALGKREVDAILMDELAAEYWALNYDDTYKLLDNEFPVGNGYGVMASLENKELIAKVNQAIKEIEADDTYIQLYKQYFTL
ncbi:transporter substrate-binding domain-containing protein [Legionella yabuuchiae]|uniref:transporter substrate-binding domain-containing protein n=1 Tax=Legionella yabuuchiae TaxID=376727 RepID=UPI0013EFBA01|nr:transporter substrate-binding domain-containing protein [Legionella yabuuchiae]